MEHVNAIYVAIHIARGDYAEESGGRLADGQKRTVVGSYLIQRS